MVEQHPVVQGRAISLKSIRPMKKQFNGLTFQLWEYRVSHGQMLIRSPKSPTQEVNVDIAFAGVEYVDLPRYLRDLEIDEPVEADIAFAVDRLGKPVEAKAITVLKVSGKRHVVVAAVANVSESDMDIFESPFR
jgi:hypothetical protein